MLPWLGDVWLKVRVCVQLLCQLVKVNNRTHILHLAFRIELEGLLHSKSTCADSPKNQGFCNLPFTMLEVSVS